MLTSRQKKIYFCLCKLKLSLEYSFYSCCGIADMFLKCQSLLNSAVNLKSKNVTWKNVNFNNASIYQSCRKKANNFYLTQAHFTASSKSFELLVLRNSKPDLILHCSLLSILHKEMENGELSKGQKLQHINEYLNVGLPGGSALLLQPLDFSTLQCILYF